MTYDVDSLGSSHSHGSAVAGSIAVASVVGGSRHHCNCLSVSRVEGCCLGLTVLGVVLFRVAVSRRPAVLGRALAVLTLAVVVLTLTILALTVLTTGLAGASRRGGSGLSNPVSR